MGSLLDPAIHIGPVVFLLGLAAAVTCLALQLFGPDRPRLLRRALVSLGLGIAGLVIGTALGIALFCSAESAGNLCGLGGVFGTGPALAGLGMACHGALSLRASRRAS